MQDLFGSVRRSIAFNSPPLATEEPTSTSTTPPSLVDRISSSIRRSRVFSNKPYSPPPPTPPPIRWRKGELIGCGASGHVYMGMNLDSGELLAVKQVLIPSNGAAKEMTQDHIKGLEEEVKLLKNLSHPNIVRYLGTVREEESLNILLEFVPGGSISSLLGKFGPFPEPVIRSYTEQLLQGLGYLHNNGIMHRDIKGANILVDNKGCIKLADFGASKQVVELATITGAKSMKGTVYWMAPEVILQTGHSCSADIWSVGCTVIEMATGKPPWSQQYQEVAAFYFIGSTKSHPEIPEHLSAEAKDFLLRCLQKEPNMRADATNLLQHPFITGKVLESHPVIDTLVMEHSEISLQSHPPDLNTIQMSVCPDTSDVCNLGTLSYSTNTKNLSKNKLGWGTNNSDEDMCQIGKDDFTAGEIKLTSCLNPYDFSQSCDSMCELSGDWGNKFGANFKQALAEKNSATTQESTACPRAFNKEENSSFPLVASLSEDDDELTESKIRSFLDEKAFELKKLQTPLYEEFYNSLNEACSPNFAGRKCDETTPNYMKLPPKSRSPKQVPVGSPSAAAGAGSPGSNCRRVSHISNVRDHSLDENLSPQHNDQKGPLVDAHQESSCPSMSFSERQRKWKEELDQELERKREMMRIVGVGGKSSSPNDRALNKQRTRFASPGR